MPDSLAVFVNTSDGFADCWRPFFDLFGRYGGALRSKPIYLNTERAHYGWPGLAITTTRVWQVEEAERPSWSECLSRGLDSVAEQYVLYMQEDYFLTRPTVDEFVAEALSVLECDSSVGVVYLNRYGPRLKRTTECRKHFVEIVPPAGYLASTQAAIWRKDFLQSLIRPWENGWMFEKFGSIRASRGRHKLLSVDPMIMRDSPVIDYIYTGIIKGRWNRECVPLFDAHVIRVDYEWRGFHVATGRLRSRIEVLRKILGTPSAAVRSISNLVGG
jgi:hypothetical protein